MTFKKEFLEEISQNKLKVLDLHVYPFEDGEAEQLATVLTVNTSIKEIILNLSILTDRDLRVFTNAILKHTKLDYLNIRDTRITDASFDAVSKLFTEAKLDKIDISYTHIGKTPEKLKEWSTLVLNYPGKIKHSLLIPEAVSVSKVFCSYYESKATGEKAIEMNGFGSKLRSSPRFWSRYDKAKEVLIVDQLPITYQP